MFLYYFSLDNEKNNFPYPEVVDNFELVDLSNGFYYYNESKCNNTYQLLGKINTDGSIQIKNRFEINFQTYFLCYDDFISYIKSQNFFFKLSVILFDEKNIEFHLCRDLFGQTPLYFIHIPDKIIAFSTSLSSLVTLPSLVSYLDINTTRVSEYLTWFGDSTSYSTSTFYSNFESVLPGEKVILSQSNKSRQQFCAFSPVANKNSSSKEKSGEEFQRLFKRSVERSLNKTTAIAAQLSGGLDSSSISSTIRQLEPDKDIYTIYADTNTLFTDEQKFANEVADDIHSKHHVIRPEFSALESATLHTSIYAHPEYMQNSSALNRSIITSAVSYGCSNLFSGHPGDAIVGYGKEFIVDLFNRGQWYTLKQSISVANQQMEHLNLGVENPSHKIIYSLLATKKGVLPWYKILGLVIKASKYFNIPPAYFVKSAYRKVIDRFKIPRSILNTSRLSKLDMTEINESISVNNPDDPGLSMFYDVFTRQLIIINEEFYILDNYYGIQHEFPFYDKDLFEFCMSVPAEIKYDNGRHRGHLREGMKGILPENVRNRTSKANFGLYGRKATIELYYDSQELLANHENIWEFVNKKEFDRSVRLLLDDNEELYVYNKMLFFVSRTIYLAIWLKQLKDGSFKSLIH